MTTPKRGSNPFFAAGNPFGAPKFQQPGNPTYPQFGQNPAQNTPFRLSTSGQQVSGSPFYGMAQAGTNRNQYFAPGGFGMNGMAQNPWQQTGLLGLLGNNQPGPQTPPMYPTLFGGQIPSQTPGFNPGGIYGGPQVSRAPSQTPFNTNLANFFNMFGKR